MAEISFPWPARRPDRAIVPVFLPFAGCPSRCLYCAQHLQTAQGLPEVETELAKAEVMLAERVAQGRPAAELAFYGGTFTAQREQDFALCLRAAEDWLRCGRISSWRCSTRPDSLGGGRLERAQDAGCALVELGIQSFSDAVLQASLRGYTAAEAAAGIEKVHSAGLPCAVQLLPGLPLSTVEGFVRDVDQAIALGCDLLRFYPCLVVRTTGLARLYERGEYRPWDVPETVEALARGLMAASLARVPVTRLGVAYEQEFEKEVLAGPRDPDLGTKVRSRALILAVHNALPAGAKVLRARLPRQVQGYLFGYRGESAADLAQLGLTPVSLSWHDEERVVLETK